MFSNGFSQRFFWLCLVLSYVCVCMLVFKQAKASGAAKKPSVTSKHELFELKKGKKSFTFGLNYSLSLTGNSLSDSNSQEALNQAKELNPQFDFSEQSSLSHNFGIAGSIAYFVSDNLAVFASVSFSLQNYGDAGISLQEGKTLPSTAIIHPSFSGNIEFGLKYFFSVSRYFLPYIGGGIYYSFSKRTNNTFQVYGTDQQGNSKQVDLAFDTTSHRFSAGIRLGALIPVTKNVALDIGGRATLERVWAQAGVSYFF